MGFCCNACSLGIALAQRIYDVAMLTNNDIDPIFIGISCRPQKKKRIVQRARGFQQETVTCGAVKAEVKVLIEAPKLGVSRSVAIRSLSSSSVSNSALLPCLAAISAAVRSRTSRIS